MFVARGSSLAARKADDRDPIARIRRRPRLRPPKIALTHPVKRCTLTGTSRNGKTILRRRRRLETRGGTDMKGHFPAMFGVWLALAALTPALARAQATTGSIS